MNNALRKSPTIYKPAASTRIWAFLPVSATTPPQISIIAMMMRNAVNSFNVPLLWAREAHSCEVAASPEAQAAEEADRTELVSTIPKPPIMANAAQMKASTAAAVTIPGRLVTGGSPNGCGDP